MDYRNDLEASRLRIGTLEAKLEESEASLKVREAELAECKAERDRLRKTGSSGPSRFRSFVYITGTFVAGTFFGLSLGLHLSSHDAPNTAVGTVQPQPENATEPAVVAGRAQVPREEPQPRPAATEGRALVPPPETIPSSAIAMGPAGDTAEAKSIQTIVDEARPKVRECYLKESAKNADAHGTVNVTFDIEPSGKVSRVELSGMFPSSAHWWSKDFDNCVTAVFRKLDFPPSKDASKTTAKGSYFFTALDKQRQFE